MKLNTMDSIGEWFPYPSYRPYQRSMLEMAAKVASEGGICMIDAPTGYGKSSVVSALLSEAGGRKLIIAVRTLSQLTTFLRELSLIRNKKPALKFTYLIGKANACPMHGEGNVYRRCEVLKALSLSLMKGRAREGCLIPSRDPVIRRQMEHQSRERPLICPFYIGSRIFMEDEELRLVHSSPLRTMSHRLISEVIPPERLIPLCREICPYEVMMHSARMADVVILNFQHIFDEEIRSQIYASMGIEPQETLLLIDEAHNCGDAVQSAQSTRLERAWLDEAAQELGRHRRKGGRTVGPAEIISRISEFIDHLRDSDAAEDVVDADRFVSYLLQGTLYEEMGDLLQDLLRHVEEIRQGLIEAGDFRITGVERLSAFLYGVYRASDDPSFMLLYQRDGDGIALEVRNIDPAQRLSEIAGSHACCVMMSGTFSPLEGFRRYYFPEDARICTLSLPCIFPRENRLIICAGDVTTTFSLRGDRENRARIERYILEFSHASGNLAIYFPSYQMLELYSTVLSKEKIGRPIFIEPRDSVHAASSLKEFLSLPERGEEGIMMAVCGGKWSEGLDYSGELLSGAMVIGLPLSPYNQLRRRINEYFRSKFGADGEFLCYTVPAMNRALQAIGRVLRTPEDRGLLVLADRRFLEPRIRQALPTWIQEEMRIATAETLGELVRGWK